MLVAPKQMKELIETWPAEVVVDILATMINVSKAVENLEGIETDPEGFVSFNYDYMVGDAPRLVETYNDLKEIEIIDFTVKEKFNNITEAAGTFDVAEFIADKKFALLINITSNSGGTAYYIPSKFYMSCPNIVKSIQLTSAEYDNGSVQ